MRVYLDNCCYNRPFDIQDEKRVFLETQAKMYIQSLVRLNLLELASSYMLVYENKNNPHEVRRNSIDLFLSENVSVFVSNEQEAKINSMAAPIMKTGIKTKDAIHVACAIYSDCDYFITTDKRLLKYSDNRIKLINPIDFKILWEANL